MTSTYDSTGITLDRYSDVLARLIVLCKEEWGDSVNTDEDGFLGHMIRLISLLVAENNEVLQDVYDAMSVTNATGTRLASLLELIGMERQTSAYSTATLTLTASKATTVPAGSQYKTDAGVIFATDSDLVFTAAGSSTVAATCTIVGPFNAAKYEIDTIVTSVYGITAVLNDAAATPGRYQETDTELKERHTIAVSTSGDSDAASIYEAVSAVTGVSNVSVVENDTAATVNSIPPHGIHVIVQGGDEDDIAEAIALTKTTGVPTYGDEDISYYDTTTRQAKTIYFDQAVEVLIYIDIEATVDATAPEDWQEQVETNILALFDDLRIGDDVIYTTLYRPIYDVAGVTVTSLEIGEAPSPSGTSNITIDSTELAYTTAAAIAFGG